MSLVAEVPNSWVFFWPVLGDFSDMRQRLIFLEQASILSIREGEIHTPKSTLIINWTVTTNKSLYNW